MAKDRPSTQENVDIELEYKLLHLYDRIKPYLKYLIVAVLILIFAIIFIIYYKGKLEEKNNQASVIVYEIGKEINNKNYDETLKKIKLLQEKFSDTDYIKLAYAYKLIIEKEKNSVNKDTVHNLEKNLNTNQSKGYFTEFNAYLNYKDKNYEKALSELDRIQQDNFNYYSALTLKALILNKEGKNDKAKELFSEIKEFSKDKYPYFESLANENI
jgi:predicted negative regulator of RcsB-dependent stress response